MTSGWRVHPVRCFLSAPGGATVGEISASPVCNGEVARSMANQIVLEYGRNSGRYDHGHDRGGDGHRRHGDVGIGEQEEPQHRAQDVAPKLTTVLRPTAPVQVPAARSKCRPHRGQSSSIVEPVPEQVRLVAHRASAAQRPPQHRGQRWRRRSHRLHGGCPVGRNAPPSGNSERVIVRWWTSTTRPRRPPSGRGPGLAGRPRPGQGLGRTTSPRGSSIPTRTWPG